MTSAVLVSQDDGIVRITLNRPKRLNALTQTLLADLRREVRCAVNRENVRVICIQGAGRAFCAGQDLSERDPRGREEAFDLEAIQKTEFHPLIRDIAQCDKPIVAKVQGVVAGAGIGLIAACDIVVAAESTKFAFSFSNVGLSVDAGGGWFCTYAMGAAKTRAALMLGETLTAEQADRLGLIWRSVPDSDLECESDAILSTISAKPRFALSRIKKAVQTAQDCADLESYLPLEARLQGEAGKHPDYAEGVLAFLEKRKPEFSKV